LNGGAAPIIVSALLGDHDFAFFDGLRRAHFPPERNVLSAHLTLFHHLPPSVEAELMHRLGEAARAPRPPAQVTGVFSLGRGVAYRIESSELADIRDDLATAFAPLLTPQDAAPWRAHVTVQNKVMPDAARALLGTLQRDFVPRPVVITGLAAWWYRGGPWEAIGARRFRG
jgi:hypothetical protein